MSQVIDNLIAYRVLSMLVKPFVDTDAYKMGIIDNKGKNLIKPSALKTEAEKEAYTYLHRLVFNMKRLINKLPGGESKLKSLIAALFLIKEYYEKNDKSIAMMEEKFNKIMESDIVLAEESITVTKFLEQKQLEEEGEGGAPTNSTGAATSTDIVVPKAKDIKKYQSSNVAKTPGSPIAGMARRAAPKI